jgi:hypothetical protein
MQGITENTQILNAMAHPRLIKEPPEGGLNNEPNVFVERLEPHIRRDLHRSSGFFPQIPASGLNRSLANAPTIAARRVHILEGI